MRKMLICTTIGLTIFVISMFGGIIYFKVGISELKWVECISIVSILFLMIMLYKFLFDMVYYQKKVIENYRAIYKRFKELHKIRYKMYFTSVDNEKIEQASQLLNEYVKTILILGTEIRYDDDFPQSYRTEVEEIIVNTLILSKQIQS